MRLTRSLHCPALRKPFMCSIGPGKISVCTGLGVNWLWAGGHHWSVSWLIKLDWAQAKNQQAMTDYYYGWVEGCLSPPPLPVPLEISLLSEKCQPCVRCRAGGVTWSELRWEKSGEWGNNNIVITCSVLYCTVLCCTLLQNQSHINYNKQLFWLLRISPVFIEIPQAETVIDFPT